MTLISFFPEMNAAQAENILNSGESKNGHWYVIKSKTQTHNTLVFICMYPISQIPTVFLNGYVTFS